MLSIYRIGIPFTILAIFSVGLYTYIGNLKGTIAKLEKSNTDMMISYGTCRANKATLENSIFKQNAKVKALSLDIGKAQKELSRLNTLPSKVRYKTIYKTIYKGASNECKDIKSILDSVRNYTL